MRWLIPSHKRNNFDKIINDYPNKYTKPMQVTNRITDILLDIDIILVVLVFLKVHVQFWEVLVSILLFLMIICSISFVVLDYRIRRKGNSQGKYWNYWS
ncbi:hypothetical protein DS830_08760 [Bombilactobacillus bombi]|nr:hypothetical protein DS830_08760 [Bombilactobacillus bombi]MCO6540894.1 hypothetical protein [Lactobacillus sp.]